MRRFFTSWRRAVVATVGGLIVFFVGLGIGASGGGDTAGSDAAASPPTVTVTSTRAAGTVTETETHTETMTRTVTKRVVKKKLIGPPNEQVRVNYADWNGLFKVAGAHITSSYGTAEVIGTFTYVGGATCKPGYTEVSATFYNDGKVVGTNLTNWERLSKGATYPLEIIGPDGPADKADLVISDASCR